MKPRAQQRLLQSQLEQQEPDQRVEEIETKASIMHTALCSANISGQVRVDEASGMVSIIDVTVVVPSGEQRICIADVKPYS